MTECGLPLRLHRRSWLLLPLLASLGHWAAAQAAERTVLRVGLLHNYHPFSAVHKGHIEGFEFDVVHRLAQILQVSLQIVADGMGPLQQQLVAGEIDLLGNQLLATTEHRRQFDFVRSFASNQLVCVQHEDDPRDFLSLDDLFGKRLGVLARTGIEAQARDVLGKTVVAYEQIAECLRDLGALRLDAVLEESLIVEYHIERDRLPIKVTAPFAPPMAMGMAVAKGQLALRDRLSGAVAQMLRDGSFQAISMRWFGLDVSRARSGHSIRG
jgi:L-cystine transport system substrate-binding protein